ncbi:BrnT family toxin [Desulfobacula sp.]|uniref:BrnT family toxin n=1 Tax=Desulfobacula sp. TaxID=2593537 RepID=UPI0019A5ECF6|nr:BrnT family toxin [Candidatus Brocadiales bacterium]MBL6996485.1 BrnT family toxin [Desulfobacula sp.]
MAVTKFEWDEKKNEENKDKHGLGFEMAQYAFSDPDRIIAEDLSHSEKEKRFYCFGRVNDGVITVRFTYRRNIIRIFGAGYRRKGKKIYEDKN